MTVTKATFMQRKKIRAIPPHQREQRWKQHLMSEGGLRDQHIKGRGNYFTSAKNWANKQLSRLPKGSFARAGHHLAGPMGEAAGALLSQITGHGDYSVKRNSLIENGLHPSEMSFSPGGAAKIRVKKREFVENIVVPDDPVAFDQRQYRLQPTNQASFPWLSTIAVNFQEWELHGAIFSFESTCSNYSADMALGTIAFATQYNANEMPYNSMDGILQAAFHSRANPSESLMHGIECDPKLQASEHLFTRRHGTSGPPNLYDHGVTTFATEGLPATAGTVIGRIFVTYDIELNMPALRTDSLFNGQYAKTWSVASTTTPPLGEATAVTDLSGSLSYGSAAGSNILALSPSNGPWARPQVAVADQSSLVGWISDSSIQAGVNYVSFANPGIYIMEVTVFGVTEPPSAGLITDVVVTSEVVLTSSTNSFANDVQWFRYRIECKSTDQSIKLTRQLAENVQSFMCLTVAH